MNGTVLKTPIFVNGSFNRFGKRMKVVLFQEVSTGDETYAIYHKAGKPDNDLSRNEEDNYYLHVEVNGYLVPLNVTEWRLKIYSGDNAAVREMFGSWEEREAWRNEIHERYKDDITRANEICREKHRQEHELAERLGNEPVNMALWIKSSMDTHIDRYLTAKENGGQSHPDYCGALALGELEHCMELSAIYRQHLADEEAAKAKQRTEENRIFCAEQNAKAEQSVADAIHIIKNGGILQNDPVTFYESSYRSTTACMVNYLMRKYNIEVPLRTQGWINQKLSKVKIQDGRCYGVSYMNRKSAKCSELFFTYMDALITVIAQEA